jgi:AcrR family transcriptional regulator
MAGHPQQQGNETMPPRRDRPETQTTKRGKRSPQNSAGLSVDRLVDGALELIDTGGIEELSMRKLADHLDTGPASLYVHVGSREELLEHVLDRVLGEVEVPTLGSWEDRVAGVALRIHDCLTAHADLAHTALGGIASGFNALKLSDQVLGVMLDGGVSPRSAAWMLDVMFLFIAADAYECALYNAKAQGVEEEQHTLSERIEQLDQEMFPNLYRTAPYLVQGGKNERFELGIYMLISGLRNDARDNKQPTKASKSPASKSVQAKPPK